MRKLLLFDIDGTLITSGGAGVRAMTLALADLYGVEDGLTDVAVAGRIDTGIIRGALAKHGIPSEPFDEIIARFHDAYCEHLARTLTEAEGRVLPGVRELLTALQSRPDVRLSLATGNFRRGAELKLAYYDLWRFFDGGAFAEDCEERSGLVAAAKRNLLDGHSDDSAVYVIGDTVHDIEAAQANNAIAVAVATGFSDADTLRAARPDFLFDDFSDWGAVIDTLGLYLSR